jgi:hypothetical protein
VPGSVVLPEPSSANEVTGIRASTNARIPDIFRFIENLAQETPSLYRSGRNAPSSFSIVIDKYHTVTINDRLRR